MINGLDLNKSGQITYSEFLAATIDSSIYLKPKYLQIAFDTLDREQNGYIDLCKLKEILVCYDEKVNEEQRKVWKEMIKGIDKKEGEKISFEEFVSIMEK